MKKILLLAIMCCMSICAIAQEHLSFKGIPITGSMTSFCQSLKDKGFSSKGSDGNIRLFKGDFTGRTANVKVIAADNGKDVYSVVVSFDESDRWKTLVGTYEYYKDLYIEKYETPVSCIEDNPHGSDSNVSAMLTLEGGLVTYKCIFEAPGGIIELSIEKGDYFKGFVQIVYKDNQNTQAKRYSDFDEI